MMDALILDGYDGVDFPTDTSRAQMDLERNVRALYASLVAEHGDDHVESALVLHREKHAAYLRNSLRTLSASFVVLDASRAWLCYWIVHALALLGESLEPDDAEDVVVFLGKCQHPEQGGFGGGPGQLPHLAPTYAAVCCLATLGGPNAWDVVHRPALLRFLTSCKDPNGGFRMHAGGETDTR